MNKRILAGLLLFGIMMTSSAAVSAAQVDISPSSARIEAGVVAADYAPVGSELEPSSLLPSSYSSRDPGYTTPVRSQVYNTCWAYSSTAVTEVLLSKLRLGVGHLSPMDMNFRSVKQEDGTGWQRGYTDAGYPYIALGDLTSFGAFKDTDVPQSMTAEEYASIKDGLSPYVYAESIIYLDGSDLDTVKTAVYDYGAAVGNFHYDSSLMNSSTSSYYCDTVSIPTANLYGHAIAIVGWDDDYDPANFVEGHRPLNKGAWLCKNSWGTWWSQDDGYFWISYEDMHLFDSRFGPSYAISGIVLADDTLRIKQNETYGATYEFDYPEQLDSELSSLTYANTADFSDGFDIIDKVTFESTSQGSAYDIFYIPTDAQGVPTADESAWVLLYTDIIGYQGFICADIEDYTVTDSRGAIGVRIRRTDESSSVAIGTDEWLSSSNKSIFIPDSTYGSSYLMGYRDTAYDLMDFYRDMLDDEIGGTFVIKLQTRSGRLLGDVDGDGKVDIFDAASIQKSIAGTIGYPDYEAIAASDIAFRTADIDGNGNIDIFDASLIQKWIAGDTGADSCSIGEQL